MTEIKGKSAEIVWKKALKHILDNGKNFMDRNDRLCKECLNVILKVENTNGITKPIEILNSFDKWVYPNVEEIKSSVLGKSGLNRYYYDYANRIFIQGGINQLEDYIIPLLKKDPNTRRALIILYSPKKDSFLSKKEAPGMTSIHFNIRDNKLYVTSVIRSNDIFYGWPGNIVQSYFLGDYVSKKINIPLVSVDTISISAHIFEDQFEYIEKVLKMKRGMDS